MYQGTDISYFILPNIIANAKTGNILYDTVFVLIMMVAMSFVSEMSKNILSKISKNTQNLIYNRQIKSEITITVTATATNYTYNPLNSDIPKQYLAILYHMYINDIDAKYIRQIINQKFLTVAGFNNESKMGIRKINEENKYKYFIDNMSVIKIDSDKFISSTCLRNDLANTTKDSNLKNTEFMIYDVKLYSYTLTVKELKKCLYDWVDEYETYLREINKDKLFYLIYDKKTENKIQAQSQLGNRNFEEPKKTHFFEIHEFITNKSFDNIFFEDKNLLKNKLDEFSNNKNIYNRLGRQYSLGLLFHGSPGCGKTSTIKAIAQYTNRNIVNIPLSEIDSYKQLRDIFYTEEYESINLEFNKKIIVFEDIDSMSDIIHDREVTEFKKYMDKINQDNQEKKNKEKKNMKGNILNLSSDNNNSKPNINITLSDILNLLDGILEHPGRIIIMTSNYPDKIDPALLRFGRIDMKIEFKLCNPDIIKEIIEHYYQEKIDYQLNVTPYRFSPTDIIEICFRSNNINEMIEKLYIADKNYKPKQTPLEKYIESIKDSVKKINSIDDSKSTEDILRNIEITKINIQNKLYTPDPEPFPENNKLQDSDLQEHTPHEVHIYRPVFTPFAPVN